MVVKIEDEEIAGYYCPYIPLLMEFTPPDIAHESGNVFRLRCNYDTFKPRAEKAFRWIEDNVPAERRESRNAPHSSETFRTRYGVLSDADTTNRDLFIEFFRQEDAALFKLMFL
jgi:hypothetical protein